MGKSLQTGLRRLVGTLGIGKLDVDKFTRECAEMNALGYYGVYFNDIFFTIENTDCSCPDEDILFREDECLIVRRNLNELGLIKNILQEYDLQVPSAHFLSILPQPGAKLESTFETHKKILDMAQFMQVQRVTTHVGQIAVPTASLLPEKLRTGELNYVEYCKQLKVLYGKDEVIPDCITVYRHLCREAAKRNITVTIETACCELYEVNIKPEIIIDFIKQVGTNNLKICIDAGHCHLSGLDIVDIIKKCGNYFVETHFHDNFGQKDRHNPIGIGTINWLDIIKTINENDYQGVITFEQSDYLTNYQNWNLFLEQVEKDLNNQRT
jgi:sugar phosphate isomerase/epimerase